MPSISIMLLCYMPVAVLLYRCVHCYHATLLPVVAVLLHRYRPFLSCCAASSSATVPVRPLLSCYSAPVVAVLLHRYRPFLSCCAASSSATAPMASITTVSCCSATGGSSATAPTQSISFMLRC
ncbi:hypothetical protein PR003_g19764 [Phytophthora rubi]|uniref:Secreted peptide n=1 Tax=Phytophthora rubi TaxID=129364 RepID=A0A6A4E514_9STRA|nr:hypothetical protein PR002_g19177 [Phytophthora rubi]KAE9000842.1 hypothetical protein PR001_g18678 [Phytophthora rubi]KAE9312416.1 hypothetical protein PR003_g19764 [Phytophthora rubi]